MSTFVKWCAENVCFSCRFWIVNSFMICNKTKTYFKFSLAKHSKFCTNLVKLADICCSFQVFIRLEIVGKTRNWGKLGKYRKYSKNILENSLENSAKLWLYIMHFASSKWNFGLLHELQNFEHDYVHLNGKQINLINNGKLFFPALSS